MELIFQFQRCIGQNIKKQMESFMFLDVFYIKQYPCGEKTELYNHFKENSYPRSWILMGSALGI